MIKAMISLLLMIVPAYATDMASDAQARAEHKLQQQLDLINAGRSMKGLPITTMDQLKAQRREENKGGCTRGYRPTEYEECVVY